MYCQLFFLASAAVLVAAHGGHDHTHEPSVKKEGPIRGVARLESPGTHEVHGNVTFTQEEHKVHIHGHVHGMPPGEYALVVYESGDITGGCHTTGAHFNPDNNDHGHPDDENRHAGDLGNIEFNSEGYSHFDIYIVDKAISLCGPRSFIGRALVLHSMADDFGKTEHPDSKITGNAGDRVACGVIGILY